MKQNELFLNLQMQFHEIVKKYGLEQEKVSVQCRALTAEEAIGNTLRKDFPIIAGKDVMIQADFKGSKGQAFTDSPTVFEGCLQDILNMDVEKNSHDRSVFIAVLNAVMCHLKLCEGTVHCKTEGPELCAKEMLCYLEKNYPKVKKIALIGYQPALLEMLSNSRYEVRVLDLNPSNVGSVRYGVCVEDGIKAYDEIVNSYADLILCTGSTLCNGTIVNYMDLKQEVLFFGTTIAGSADMLGLKRVCFAEQLSQ